MKKFVTIILLLTCLGFYSCEKFLEPGKYNNLLIDDILSNPTLVEGILMTAYNALPDNYYFYYDAITDDAVTNVTDSQYKRMATGEWSSIFYPGSPWISAYTQISYINKFLSVYQSVKYSVDVRNGDATNAIRDALHKKRLKGEAYALRAWYKWQLLQYYSGKAENGTLLGFPIIDEILSTTGDWKKPRNTFAECVESILSDCDSSNANLPPKYADTGDGDQIATTGSRYENRFNGNAARALKSRVQLLAASPAFAASNAATWTEAATTAGSLLKDLPPLLATGKTFYTDIRNDEIIWNQAQRSIRTWETNNFAPTLFGNGNTNPSQNLVDAFPMQNGYPITDLVNSGYDAAAPYTGRDTRLSDYIIRNGQSFKSTIYTYIGAASNGINVLTTSTRTGYYLKKFMSSGVNLNPSSPVSTAHTFTLFRMTEVLLNYAEAANEAWGPDGDPNGYGFTARTKIAELRARAGITAPDPYLASLTTAAQLRDLIKNERRIELCFEGFRFWDIRRWNDVATMQAPVKAVYITNNSGTYTYEYDDIENRDYTADMIYGPIPYNETLKYNIVQNKGW